MSAWTKDQLARIGGAEEVEIAPFRKDGTPRKPVTVWVVQTSDEIYVRSAVTGPKASWFRAVQETHRGRVWAGGVEIGVTFVEAGPAVNDEVDAAYRAKYRRYAGRILDSCLTPEARSTTMKLVPPAG